MAARVPTSLPTSSAHAPPPRPPILVRFSLVFKMLGWLWGGGCVVVLGGCRTWGSCRSSWTAHVRKSPRPVAPSPPLPSASAHWRKWCGRAPSEKQGCRYGCRLLLFTLQCAEFVVVWAGRVTSVTPTPLPSRDCAPPPPHPRHPQLLPHAHSYGAVVHCPFAHMRIHPMPHPRRCPHPMPLCGL